MGQPFGILMHAPLIVAGDRRAFDGRYLFGPSLLRQLRCFIHHEKRAVAEPA
jgi:hypothetical protein